MRFTDRSIAALKSKKERYEKWEDGRTGLGIRVSPAGRKSWIYMYRFDGKARRMTLGTYPALTLANARIEHAKAKKELHLGRDPGADLKDKREAERNAETVKVLVDEYLKRHARPNKRSADYDDRLLNKEVIPAWGTRKASSITRRDVIALLDSIVDRGSPAMANRTLACIRKMFNFAVSRDIVNASPCIMIEKPAEETPRDRTLTADEIRTFWHGLDETKISKPVKLALQFMLITGQRRNEGASAAKKEFDREKLVWEIPAERSKNKRANQVPLSALAVEILEEAWKLSGNSEWLFVNPKTKESIRANAISRALRKNLKNIGLENVRPHDLRRTAATGIAELGFSRLVLGRVLNHTDSSITGIYDRHSYDAEKRAALDAWGAQLTDILTGETRATNVVTLAANREPA